MYVALSSLIDRINAIKLVNRPIDLVCKLIDTRKWQRIEASTWLLDYN